MFATLMVTIPPILPRQLVPYLILDTVAADTGRVQRLRHTEQQDGGPQRWVGLTRERSETHPSPSVAVSLLQLPPEGVAPKHVELQPWLVFLVCAPQELSDNHCRCAAIGHS